jgi:hypothetical protein
MDYKTYFKDTRGTGVLSTAADGRVDSAIYSRPHVMDDGTIAFIMRDRLSHSNLQKNPYAAFLFKEDGPGYKGRRFMLKKNREETDPAVIDSLRRRVYLSDKNAGETSFLVYFEIEKIRPLVGDFDDAAA